MTIHIPHSIPKLNTFSGYFFKYDRLNNHFSTSQARPIHLMNRFSYGTTVPTRCTYKECESITGSFTLEKHMVPKWLTLEWMSKALNKPNSNTSSELPKSSYSTPVVVGMAIISIAGWILPLPMIFFSICTFILSFFIWISWMKRKERKMEKEIENRLTVHEAGHFLCSSLRL